MRSRRIMAVRAAALAGGILLAAAAVTGGRAVAQGAAPGALQGSPQTGHVIFMHPDGAALNNWNAARMVWNGPDAALNWDRLPEMAVYRGHMFERMVGTSNGGATVHAFGYKVYGPGSFGADGGEVDGPVVPDLRLIKALSGYPGSILREAANAGHPVGVVNDGDAAEPGTGAFLAEVGSRTADVEIAQQIIRGRPKMSDADPWVVLGGGEGFFLPSDTPQCGERIEPGCFVHRDPVTGAGPNGPAGQNLVREALAKGYTVVRTRAEFDALMAQVKQRSDFAPKVLGLFARDDIFNDVPEERLISNNPPLVDPAKAGTKEGRLVLWGTLPGTPGYNPPTVAEMTEMALMILERRAAQAGKPFLLVAETESVDNFGNANNAIGALQALKRADDAIGIAQAFQQRRPDTLILLAADSDGGAMQVIDSTNFNTSEPVTPVTSTNANPTGQSAANVANPLDGIEGRATAPFVTAADAFGATRPIAISWPGTADYAGAILARAQGLNADKLRSAFSQNFDNTDVYRLMYLTLFGKALPSAAGKTAPTR